MALSGKVAEEIDGVTRVSDSGGRLDDGNRSR